MSGDLKPQAEIPLQYQMIIYNQVKLQVAQREMEITKKAIKNATEAIAASFFIVLHDKHGWGKTRLNRISQQVAKQFRLIDEGFVKIDDFEQWCKDYGIEI